VILEFGVRSLALLGMTILASVALAQSPAPETPVDQLIPWLLDPDIYRPEAIVARSAK
jgi:hypothetical protein